MLNPNKPPGSNFDLSKWELDLPIKKGNSVEIIPTSQLSNGYSSEYFYTDKEDGAMTFFCPSNGATTPNSKYPRSELRELGEWKLNKGNHALYATCEVVQLPNSGKGVYIGQLHGLKQKLHPQLIKLLWGHDNTISVQVQKDSKPGTEPIYSFGQYSIGEKISYNISVTNKSSTCVITVNVIDKSGTKSHSFTYKNNYWSKDTYYFKAGNYLQNHDSSNSSSVVKFYELDVIHS